MQVKRKQLLQQVERAAVNEGLVANEGSGNSANEFRRSKEFVPQTGPIAGGSILVIIG